MRPLLACTQKAALILDIVYSASTLIVLLLYGIITIQPSSSYVLESVSMFKCTWIQKRMFNSELGH
jgi:hypothetical protein